MYVASANVDDLNNGSSHTWQTAGHRIAALGFWRCERSGFSVEASIVPADSVQTTLLDHRCVSKIENPVDKDVRAGALNRAPLRKGSRGERYIPDARGLVVAGDDDVCGVSGRRS